MADNNANIRVTANDQEVNDLNQSVDTLNRELRDTESQAKQTERAVDKLDNSFDGLNTAANVASAAMDGMRAAAEIARRAFEIVGEAVRVFAEESEEGAEIVGALEESFVGLQAELGRAVIATEGGQEAVRTLIGVFNGLQSVVIANQDQIGELSSTGARTLVDGINVMGQALIQFQSIWTGLSIIADTFFLGVGNGFRIVSVLINSLLAALGGALGGIANGLALVLDGAELAARSIGMSGLAREIGTASRALNNFGDALFDDAGGRLQEAGEQFERGFRTTESVIRGMGDRIVSSANFENNINALLDGIENAISTAVIEGPTITTPGGGGEQSPTPVAGGGVFGIAAAANIQAAQLMAAQAVEQAAALEQRNEQRRLADEELLEQQRLAYEAQQALAEENARRQEQIQQRLVGGVTSLNSAILAAEGKSAKERRRALRKALGQEMVVKGQALLAEGTATIAANPVKGGLQIAGGIALQAAGRAFANGGRGGGGGGSNAAPRQAVTNQDVTFIQQTQFGFVGDRRAATREIENINREALERGL